MSIIIQTKIILVGLFIFVLYACTPAKVEPDTTNLNSPYPEYNGDTLPVSEKTWEILGLADYPFLTKGDIACSNDEVYFFPEKSFNENAIGTPLNKKAENVLKRENWQANVPYKIKPNANLTKAIEVGLDICKYNIQNP